MASGNPYYSGPVCASWFGNALCENSSCWAIMTVGDSNVGGWFRYPVSSSLQELQGYLAGFEAEQNVQQEVLDFLVKLRSEQYRLRLNARARDVTMVISAYQRLISESQIAFTRMQALARALQVGAPEPPETEPIT